MFVLTPVAYIDPMSGAIILQVLIAGTIGCVAFFRRSIKAFLVKVFHIGRDTDEEGAEKAAPEDPAA